MTSVDPVCSDLLAFIQSSPTPYHAVQSASSRLIAAGFSALDEHVSWDGLTPGRYFVARAGALLAFVVPEGNRLRGFKIIGAHTDSPNLRLKPNPEYTKEGFLQLGVEVYGGALLNSWLDRDLGLAGRVILRDGGPGVLVRVDRPICRVAQLAIHLDREVNEKGVVLNRQEHLPPLLGLADRASKGALLSMIAKEANVDEAEVAWLDLMLHDLTAPTVGGLNGEFIFSARLDNLAMSHGAIVALINAASSAAAEGWIPVAALFDHEEVGSDTAYGAGAPLLEAVLERVIIARGLNRADWHRLLASSTCVSADMAHAVHPNYPDRHEARHRPVINGGPVLKVNAQQRYATCARTGALFGEICKRVDVPLQRYAHRTDLPCGSTIGPITATRLGIATVDIGNPMISMHSSREMAGADDPAKMTRALTAFYEG